MAFSDVKPKAVRLRLGFGDEVGVGECVKLGVGGYDSGGVVQVREQIGHVADAHLSDRVCQHFW